jgi:hypothetical protein
MRTVLNTGEDNIPAGIAALALIFDGTAGTLGAPVDGVGAPVVFI